MELSPPSLFWQDHAPHSEHYGDMYYKPDDGLDETRHVFLAGNALQERLRQHNSLSFAPFVVAETGFGTGLNFLALWQLWHSLPEPRPRLHYISTELHPLTMQDLQQAHQLFRELKPFSDALLRVYPPLIAGPHRRWLAGGMIQIDFLWGDAATMLATYQLAEGIASVDAWFLDGFSPAKNPDMWQSALYDAMARLSHPGTTLATFTVAGHVRRELSEAGFNVSKQRGHGQKREMTVGVMPESSIASPPSLTRNRSAIVIGAGIAGISSAWRLSQAGYQVTLLEAGSHACSGASGNLASAMTPYYTAQWNQRSRLLSSGLATMRHMLDYLADKGHHVTGNREGLLMLDIADGSMRSERLRQWQSKLVLPQDIRCDVSSDHASTIAGIELRSSGWFYPQGGWLSMESLCRALLADGEEHITTHYNSAVQSLTYRDRRWHVVCSSGDEYDANIVVVAAGYAARELLPELPLHAVYGQSTQLPSSCGVSAPNCVIHAGHTLIPLPDGSMHWGSTFHHLNNAEPPSVEADATLLRADLHAAFPNWDMEALPTSVQHWSGFRCTHPSRLPLIGPSPGDSPPGLYVNLAHGARGSLSAAVAFATGCYA